MPKARAYFVYVENMHGQILLRMTLCLGSSSDWSIALRNQPLEFNPTLAANPTKYKQPLTAQFTPSGSLFDLKKTTVPSCNSRGHIVCRLVLHSSTPSTPCPQCTTVTTYTYYMMHCSCILDTTSIYSKRIWDKRRELETTTTSCLTVLT